MTKMIRVLFLFVITLLITISTNAQQRGVIMGANIILSVKDSLTKAPLEFVTAVLTKIDKSKNKEIFTYAISDSSGSIKFNRIPVSDYEITLQYVGYFMKLLPNIKIDGMELLKGDNMKDLGVIELKENITELNAVTIVGHVVPIKYLGDTIQYNAAAFKLSDTDVLEDFFKKLPGWSVDNNGRITANGKVIEQITVNGRIFFLNDPVFVSRNLPAKLLKNIKLFEKQSNKSKYTGIDDGSRTNTVDVAIKEDMLNGWLGNVSAGGGTDERYKANSFTANFNKYNQVAIVGNASNLSELSIMPGTTQANSGKSSSYNIGSNLNLMGRKNKNSADLSYKLNGNNTVNENEVYRINYIKDSSFIYNKSMKSENMNNSHIFNGIITRIGKKSMIEIKPMVRFSYGDYSNSTKYTTTGGKSGTLLNEGESMDSGKRDAESISADFQIVTKLNKERRTLSINGSMGYDRTAGEGRNRILNKSDQKYNSDNKSLDLSALISYTEPVTKKMVLGANYRITSSFSFQNKATYDPDGNGNFIYLDTLLSDKSDNTEFKQNIELFLQKPKGIRETSYFMIGISVLPSYLNRSAQGQDFDKWFINVAPKAEFRISTPKMLQFFINYKANVRTPQLSQMMPVPDNTNPLFFRFGNKDLKSEYEHSMDLNLRQITGVSGGMASLIGIFVRASYFTNKIVNKSWFDNNGVQFSMPFNDRGDYFINSRLSFAQPFFKGKINVENSTSAGYYNNVSYVDGKRNSTKRDVIGESIAINLNIGELSLRTGASFNYEKSTNSIYPGKINKTWRNSIDGNIRYMLPFEIDFKSSLSYQFFTGYSSQNDKPYLLWNADISRPVIRNKLIFTISARDILNQNKSIQRTVTDFYIQETRYNIIRQYFMFSVTYKFFTGGKTGAFRERVNTILRSQEINQLKIDINR